MTSLLLVLLLVPLVPAQPAPAPTVTEAAWFGPTDMLDGWHFRASFSVTNPYEHPVRDATVGRDVSLSDELVKAGWVTSRKGGSPKLESWDLDLNSVRVVEYRNLSDPTPSGGAILGEVPSRAFAGMFDSTRPFNNKTSPDIHVQWVVPGVLASKATRHFYVYVDTKTNGEKPAPAYAERDMGPLDGRYWLSRGTVLYGVASHLILIGGEDKTEVRVETWQGGKPAFLDLGRDSGTSNPVQLNRSQSRILSLSTTPQPVRLVATKPIVAIGTVAQELPNGPSIGVAAPGRFGGPIPSLDGNLLGTHFMLPSLSVGAMVVSPNEPATVYMDDGAPFSLSTGSFRMLSFTDNTIDFGHPRTGHEIHSDKPVMLIAWPNATSPVQYPSPFGGPVGSRIFSLPLVGTLCMRSKGPRDCPPSPTPPCTVSFNDAAAGTLQVTSYGTRAHVRARDALSYAPLLPGTTSGSLPKAKEVLERELWIDRPVSDYECPMLVHAVSSPTADDFAPAQIAAYGGTGVPHVSTPVGGVAATRFITHWPVTVLAFHNGTQIDVRASDGATSTKGMGANDLYDVRAGGVTPTEIRSNKPVALLPMTQPGGAFIGLDLGLQVTQLRAPAYRGYMVSIEPVAGATEPMLGVAAVGKSVEYRMVVKNLAKDDRGNPVPDVVRVSVDPAAGGWSAEMSETELRLNGGESREVTLKVTPPEDVDEGAPLRLTVHATSEGNPKMADHLGIVTVVRAAYEIDAWFERENGLKSRTLTIDPGATMRVQVVVKNLAAVPDRVSLQAVSLSNEWKARLEGGTGSAGNIFETPLDPGESRSIPLLVEAPAGNASQSLVDVTAVSQNDAAAAARVSATVRLRADVRIALEAPNATVEAAPGETATLDVDFLNRGGDRVSIRFNATGILPEGWGPVVTRNGGVALDELSGIMPGERLPLQVSLRVPETAQHGQRATVQFYIETIPQAAGDVVLRESADLLVLAGQRHALRAIDPAPSLTVGEDGQVRARLTLRNDGNGVEELTVVPVDLPRGVGVALAAPTRIPQGERGAVNMTLRVSPDLAAGTYPILADVVAADGHAVPWKFNLTMPERAQARLTPLSPAGGIAGVPRTMDVEVVNEGNAPLQMPPRLAAPEGWRLAWSGGNDALALGEAAQLTLTVEAPRDASAGVVSLAPDPAWARGRGFDWDLRTVALSAGIVDTREGLKVQVKNDGTGDATDVEVVISQQGKVLDRVVMQRIPAGEESVAILLPRELGEGEVTLMVDNEAKYAEAPISLPVTDGLSAAKPVPLGGALLGLVALALVAALRVRRR